MLTLAIYGTSVGSRLNGTFFANVTGEQIIREDADGEDIDTILTGTIEGAFDVAIKPVE